MAERNDTGSPSGSSPGPAAESIPGRPIMPRRLSTSLARTTKRSIRW